MEIVHLTINKRAKQKKMTYNNSLSLPITFIDNPMVLRSNTKTNKTMINTLHKIIPAKETVRKFPMILNLERDRVTIKTMIMISTNLNAMISNNINNTSKWVILNRIFRDKMFNLKIWVTNYLKELNTIRTITPITIIPIQIQILDILTKKLINMFILVINLWVNLKSRKVCKINLVSYLKT